MGEKRFVTLQQVWFRRLTTCSAITTTGFTALLAALSICLHVKVGAAALTVTAVLSILTSLLLLQYSQRSRDAHEAESAARLDAEQTRQALERASERLRIALSAAGIGIWDIDLNNAQALALDERCHAIMGIPAGAGLDYGSFLGLVHADDRQRVHDAVNHIISGEGDGTCAIEYRVVSPQDTAPRWIRSTGQRLVDGSHFVRLVGTARDVTLDRAIEIELTTAKNKAEEANRAKDEFLAMLGHELRNPLAPMLTALELLRVRLGEAGARERDVIHRQVRNLAQLVDDMLDVAQIRKGKMTIAKE